MKRVLQLFIFSLTGLTATAQDLAYKIPEKAFAVASVKSNQLFQLFSVKEFDTSFLGKKLLSSMSEKTNGDFTSIEDFGFNLSSTAYYYYQRTDSMNYNCLLISLSDAKKFEKLFSKEKGSTIQQQGDVRTLQIPASKTMLIWNNETLLLAYGSLNAFFLSDSAHRATYGLKEIAYDDAEQVVLADNAMTIDTAYSEATDTAYSEEVTDTAYNEDAIATDTAVLDYSDSPVASEETEQQHIKDSLANSWLIAYSQAVFSKTPSSPSILNNPVYQKSADKNAVASLWVDDIQSIYAGFMPYSVLKYGNVLKGYGSVNARLYLDDNSMRMTGEMVLNDKNAAAYKKIYDKKINKQFLKYIKSDSLIGFMSYAFNTEAYLNELPGIFGRSYSQYNEEMELGGELLSLMLDEQAIAKVVKGDALILMTNLSSKQVSYSTYDYDENYERHDTVKTKTEYLPDLLMMFSSDDTRLIEKLLKYGINKGKIRLENNIYSLHEGGKNPFNLNLVIKDGIVFIGTSITDIQQINAGTFKGNLDKQQKELLLDNNLTMFFCPKNLHDKLPAGLEDDMTKLMNAFLNNTGNVYLKSSIVKDNYLAVDLVADVPKGRGNALKYFLSMFEKL